MELASLSQYAKHKDGTYVSMDLSQGCKDILDHFVETNLGLTERVDKSTRYQQQDTDKGNYSLECSHISPISQ